MVDCFKLFDHFCVCVLAKSGRNGFKIVMYISALAYEQILVLLNFLRFSLRGMPCIHDHTIQNWSSNSYLLPHSTVRKIAEQLG